MPKKFSSSFIFLILALGGCNSSKIVTIQFSDGSYEGEVNSKEQKNGKGFFKWNDGSYYRGDFVNDLRHGQGRFLWANGESYEGDYDEDQRTGKGYYRWPDGSNFEGEFIRGLRHGNGTFFSHDGIRYEGEWLDDLQHGHGKLFFPDGKIISGTWIKGKLIASKSPIPASSESPQLSTVINHESIVEGHKLEIPAQVDSSITLLAPLPNGGFHMENKGNSKSLSTTGKNLSSAGSEVSKSEDQPIEFSVESVSPSETSEIVSELPDENSVVPMDEDDTWEGTVQEAEIDFTTELINGLDTVKYRSSNTPFSGKMKILGADDNLLGEVNLVNGLLHGEEIFYDVNGDIVEQNIWVRGNKK